ncbi:hypothetical protein ASN18_1749 [Candidatus Magnetominusculus xianensis]|uniref:Secreted protein n=1 Tax=Candidatus Magnetominusculus xianensis TaxID=1748249 RepID=A0ABR5SF13_9BACT|nr:hypothetical protein ASN18_1749 [Candidatus Magnetominusculus xianensis]
MRYGKIFLMDNNNFPVGSSAAKSAHRGQAVFCIGIVIAIT